jgi:hypothetical protein
MVWIGIAPGIFFDTIKEPVDYIVRQVDPGYFDKHPMTYPAQKAAERRTPSSAPSSAHQLAEVRK